MRERRRLALADRQAMLARVALREAMAALAVALEEERRTATLSGRARAILGELCVRSGASNGEALRESAAFNRSLCRIADQADEARHDASEQAAWQVAALAAARTRAERMEERREAAHRDLSTVLERREQPVAHKLHCRLPLPREEAEAVRPAHRSRNRL